MWVNGGQCRVNIGVNMDISVEMVWGCYEDGDNE